MLEQEANQNARTTIPLRTELESKIEQIHGRPLYIFEEHGPETESEEESWRNQADGFYR